MLKFSEEDGAHSKSSQELLDTFMELGSSREEEPEMQNRYTLII